MSSHGRGPQPWKFKFNSVQPISGGKREWELRAAGHHKYHRPKMWLHPELGGGRKKRHGWSLTWNPEYERGTNAESSDCSKEMGSEFKAVSKGRMRGTDREFGMDVYTLLYLNWVTSKVLLGTQGTLLRVKWQPGWERSWGGEWMHVQGSVPSLSTWSYHNTVNQLYSNTKYKVLKKKKWAQKAQPNASDTAHKVQKWCWELGRTQCLPSGRRTSQRGGITYGRRSGAGAG